MKRTKFYKIVDHEPLVSEEVKNMHSVEVKDKIANDFYSTKEQKFKSPIFKSDFCRQVYYLARAGFTDDRIAEFFNVSLHTVFDWKSKDLDFFEAYVQGKWLFDFQVVDSLAQRALGYEYEEVEVAEHVTKFGEVVQLKKVTTKQMAPDVTAQIFWLKNRQRENWADVKHTESTTNINLSKKVDLSTFSDEEQRLLRGIAIKQLAQQNGNTE